MNDNCNKSDKSCGTNCSDTRKQVGKIMIGFGVIIFTLAYYIMSEGLLQKAFG